MKKSLLVLKTKNLLATLAIIILSFSISNAQSWLWEQSLSSTSGIITPMKTVTDGDDIYTIAIFTDNVYINGQTYYSHGDYDMLVMKYDKLGVFEWVKHYGSIGLDLLRGLKVFNNNVYITGSIAGTTSFDGNNLSNIDDEDVFVACISKDGTFSWAKIAGYGPGLNRGYGIDVNASGIYITCGMDDEITFSNSGTGVTDIFGQTGRSGICMVKLDVEGNYISAKSFITSQLKPIFYNIEIQGSNLTMAGYFKDTLFFDSGFKLSNTANYDMFVMKTDLNLNTIWSYVAGGVSNEYIFGMDVDASGNTYLAGSYWSQVTIGTDVLTPAGTSDMLLVKIDANGNPIWAKSFGDANKQALYDVYVGDKLYVSGEFSGSFIFGSSTINSHNSNNHQAFVGTLDFNGNALYASNVNSSNDNGFNNSNSLSQNSSGSIFLTGYYQSDSLYFGANTLSKNSGSTRHGFIAKYGCPDSLELTSTPVSCVDGSGIPYSMDGTASVTYIEGGPYNYTWSNGATTANITGLDEGNYTVTVSNNACSISKSVYVGYLPHVDATITSIVPVACAGWTNGQATVTATDGNPPYTYLWSNGSTNATATGLSMGTHYVTVTDQCSNSVVRSATIGEDIITVISFEVTCTVQNQCTGTATVNVSGGTQPYSYSWWSSNSGFTGSNSASLSGLCKGLYKVTITDTYGCQVETDQKSLPNCGPKMVGTSLFATANNNIVKIYPNPADNNISLNTESLIESRSTIKIYNQIGELIKSIFLEETYYSDIKIDTDDLIPGIYLLELSNNGILSRNKFIIQR